MIVMVSLDRKMRLGIRLVARLGFEPRLTEPESAVLPLHHRAMRDGFKNR